MTDPVLALYCTLTIFEGTIFLQEDEARQTDLHPIDPVKDYLGDCKAMTNSRADATGSRVGDVLTSVYSRDGANYLQISNCNGDSDSHHHPLVAAI